MTWSTESWRATASTPSSRRRAARRGRSTRPPVTRPHRTLVPCRAGRLPNISVPVGSVDGLPIGISVFGPSRHDGLLPLAAAVERGSPDPLKLPVYCPSYCRSNGTANLRFPYRDIVDREGSRDMSRTHSRTTTARTSCWSTTRTSTRCGQPRSRSPRAGPRVHGEDTRRAASTTSRRTGPTCGRRASPRFASDSPPSRSPFSCSSIPWRVLLCPGQLLTRIFSGFSWSGMAPRRTSPAIGACTNWSRPSTRPHGADLRCRAGELRRAGRAGRTGSRTSSSPAAWPRARPSACCLERGDRAGGGGAGRAEGRRARTRCSTRSSRRAPGRRVRAGRGAAGGHPAERPSGCPWARLDRALTGRNPPQQVAARRFAVDAGRPRVRDVHVRVHRHAEGRGRPAPRDGRHAARPVLCGLRRRTRCGCSARRCRGTRSRWSCSGRCCTARRACCSPVRRRSPR